MKKILLLTSLTILLPLNSKAELTKTTQVHLLLGQVSGSFSGAYPGAFSVQQAINLEIEFTYDPKHSFMLRNILALDPNTSKNVYSVTSVGNRTYLKGSNMPILVNDLNGTKYIIRPQRRYYVGWDAGISQAVITSIGPVLDAVSTMFDLGFNTGIIHQMGENWALEGQFGYTQTFGFSSVSVSGSTMRLLIGAALFY